MTNVIELPREQMRGPARCLECRHEWEAVAPVGTYSLECPKCHTWKGVLSGFVTVPNDCEVWVCGCDSDLFYITPDYTQCARCGKEQNFGDYLD